MPSQEPPRLPAGAVRATPLEPGLARMEAPDRPRLIERWNGHAWEPHALAPDLRTAYDGMYQPPPPGRGRHRAAP